MQFWISLPLTSYRTTNFGGNVYEFIEKNIILLFDDDCRERSRIEDVMGDDYEVICESNLHQCVKEEGRIRSLLNDIDATRLRAIVVDLIDNTNGPKEDRPGERIFRWMRERYQVEGIPVVVLSVLVDSGRVKEDQLAHLNQFADAVISKKEHGDNRYQKLRRLLKVKNAGAHSSEEATQ